MRQKTSIAWLMLIVFVMSVSCGVPARQQFPEFGPDVYQPQLVVGPDRALLLVWSQRGESGYDLFLARSDTDSFSEPARVNDMPGSINSLPIDEMRPSVAVAAFREGELLLVGSRDGTFTHEVRSF